MTTSGYRLLDRAEISMNSFYPRRNWTPTPRGVEDHTVEVADGLSLSCRFFPVGPKSPTVLFFYGNGETACDYDGIAPLYNQIGANFFVADYRGYGRSGGLPAFSLMLSDAHQVLQALAKILDSAQYSKDIYVMGRSMGRHPAFEIGANAGDSIKGLIVESGRASLAQFTRGLDSSIAQPLEAAYQDKVRSITAPVLVIHGELDQLAPVQHAAVMFESFSSENKRMVTIPGAGHNDLLHQGLQEYFAAISALLFS